MQAGTKVKSLVVIQSDDRETGVDDGTPIIPVGTTGIVLGMSKDSMDEDTHLKPGCEDCVVVQFDLPDGSKFSFDVKPEVEVVAA